MQIPAISLWQPWAQLIAIKRKLYETRSWPTRIRGTVAIHAAKTWTSDLRYDAENFEEDLGLERGALTGCPRGAVVCVADLTSCVLMDEELVRSVGCQERMVGGWGPGRYAWKLENVRRLREPLPAKGRQGFFTVDVPSHLLLVA